MMVVNLIDRVRITIKDILSGESILQIKSICLNLAFIDGRSEAGVKVGTFPFKSKYL